MKQDHATFVLKLIVWALFVVGGAFNLFATLMQFSAGGLDAWSLSYLPVDLIYFAGALYVGVNFKTVISHHRLTLIKALVALFIVDTLYNIAAVIAQFIAPESFSPPLNPATPQEMLIGPIVGLALAGLVLFGIIQLITIAAGVKRTKPPLWLTATAWILVGLIIVGTIVYATTS